MRRFLVFTSVIASLTVCTVYAGKRQGGGGGGGGGGKGAARAAHAGGGGGRGMGGAGQGRGGGAHANAFGGSRAAGAHHDSMSHPAGRGGQRNLNSGGGRSTAASGQGMHSRGGAGLRNGRAAGFHHQALHSHAGFNRAQGITRVNRVHVQRYSVVYNNYHRFPRAYHDRVWWCGHYSRITFVVGGGWYYWDGGYWYPAWGYDPGFTVYAYDGPIYS